ncbi:arsenate reductase family protein [Vagococcus zengguangii]|uniref:Arsenate reductase family protein n=1 Tax=Vagococcus zengguangii TaxID=2571750 RepID=A0A4D7CRB2_9ENTE|nr:arsenate reductase family protein [Vagococcus zengguangii]QCI86599.1 arsenate reductase family protein [Vagococcus zengguangii]TLG79765.1 arsenate reductase family protein [Vagococcus zengguangii]
MINFYWYPKCSTCKKAKAWLDEHQVDYHLIDMIDDQTPTIEQILHWMDNNDDEIHRYFNTSGVIYRTENLKEVIYTMDKDDAAQMLSERGMLIRRPILENGDKVFLGWKESEYETLL